MAWTKYNDGTYCFDTPCGEDNREVEVPEEIVQAIRADEQEKAAQRVTACASDLSISVNAPAVLMFIAAVYGEGKQA